MPCLISHNVALTQFAGAGQRCIIALRYVTEDEQMNGRATMSNWGVRRERRDEERERRGGVKDEGEGGTVSMLSQWEQSEISITLTAACMHPSLQLTDIHFISTTTSFMFQSRSGTLLCGKDFLIVIISAASKWDIWCGCWRASV